MKITDLLSLDTIDLKAKAKTKEQVLDQAIKLMAKSGAIKNIKTYKQGVLEREKISTTGIGEGIALPHCKSNAVTKPHLAAMVIKDGVDFKSLDGQKAKLLFLIAAPDTKDNVHLDVLAKLSRLLMDDKFKNSLLKCTSKAQFLKAIDAAEKEKDKEAAQAPTTPVTNSSSGPKVVAVTACSTGIAHTYMAQEALDKAAKEMNISLKVETRGANVKNELTQKEIDEAEVVIIAADIGVPMERFDGKKLINVGTATAIKDAKGLIEKAFSNRTGIYKSISKSGGRRTSNVTEFAGEEPKLFTKLYRQLMAGLSHMIPFVVAGGILMAVSYIIDGAAGVSKTSATGIGTTTLLALIFNFFGNTIILGLMVPILAGFISSSIAGRQGYVSGFAAGFCATTIITIWSKVSGNLAGTKVAFNILWFIDVAKTGWHIGQPLPQLAQLAVDNAPGFLGGLMGGFIGGYITVLWQRILSKLPKTLNGARDILMIPLFSAFCTGAIMIFANAPFCFFVWGLAKGLAAVPGAAAIILGGILAGMKAVDMGGPINKAAHYFSIGLVTQAIARNELYTASGMFAQHCLASEIAGSMTPPIGIALACWVFPQKYEAEDREPAAANLVTGICGITEGAIPYCMKEPKTWIATISGSAVAGMVSWALGGVLIAPEGGTIAFSVMTTDMWRGMLGVLVGSLWTMFALGFIRKDVNPELAQLGAWKGLPIGTKDAVTKKYYLDLKLANQAPEFSQMQYKVYVDRNIALRKQLDDKLNDMKERGASPTKIKKFEFKIANKKEKYNEILMKQKDKLIAQAAKRKAKFDAAAYKKLEAEVAAKKVEIDKKEAIRVKKVNAARLAKAKKQAEKQKAKDAKLAAKAKIKKAKEEKQLAKYQAIEKKLIAKHNAKLAKKKK